jgi:hypothetical protein
VTIVLTAEVECEGNLIMNVGLRVCMEVVVGLYIGIQCQYMGVIRGRKQGRPWPGYRPRSHRKKKVVKTGEAMARKWAKEP